MLLAVIRKNIDDDLLFYGYGRANQCLCHQVRLWQKPRTGPLSSVSTTPNCQWVPRSHISASWMSSHHSYNTPYGTISVAHTSRRICCGQRAAIVSYVGVSKASSYGNPPTAAATSTLAAPSALTAREACSASLHTVVCQCPRGA
jgi:hypothetical protein